MNILCAASVYGGEEAFATLGPTRILPEDEMTPPAVREADLLIVRSRVRVDETLLKGSSVSFVGTATAGTDHLDLGYLRRAGIACCAAPGCNANSVAEYVVAALFYLGQRYGLELSRLTLGIIGAGHCGSRVAEKAGIIGMRVLRNDPPLREQTGSSEYVDLDALLRASDVITLHVPLADERPWPTRHMANHRFFEGVRAGCIFINTARGEVVDADALLCALQCGALSGAVLDVWERERFCPPELLHAVDIGTPHIAGHSLEGRLNGTLAIYQEAAHFLEMPATWQPGELPRGRGATEVELDARGYTEEEVLAEIIHQAYDITVDHGFLRAAPTMAPRQREQHFIQSRNEYAVRREFPATSVTLRHAAPSLVRKVAGLGFNVRA